MNALNMVLCPKLGYLNQFDPWLYVNLHTASQDESLFVGRDGKFICEYIRFSSKTVWDFIFFTVNCELTADANTTWKSLLPLFSPRQTIRGIHSK